MRNRFLLCVVLALATSFSLSAGVVINEIFYHAPDDYDDLEWIELHNTEKKAADLSGWKLKKAVSFNFPDKSMIPAEGYLVLCKNKALFTDFYEAAAAGEFTKGLSNSGETIELENAQGRTMDSVTFTDRAPWSSSADGNSSSLERITPTVEGNRPENWDASPLPDGEAHPAGTPGKVNSVYSATFPAIIKDVVVSPNDPKPGDKITVEAVVEGTDAMTVEARYQRAVPGVVGNMQAVPMRRVDGKKFKAELPSGSSGQLLRVHVRAVDKNAERFYPSQNSLRPAISVFIREESEVAQIGLASIIHTNPREHATMERLRKASLKGNGSPFQGQEVWQFQQMLSGTLSLPDAWLELTIAQEPSDDLFRRLRQVFVNKNKERDAIIESALASEDMAAASKNAAERLKKFQDEFVEAVKEELQEESRAKFEKWVSGQKKTGGRDFLSFLKTLVDIEGPWLAINTRFNISTGQLAKLRPVLRDALAERDEQLKAAQNIQPTQETFPAIQQKFAAVGNNLDESLQNLLSQPQRRFLGEYKSGQGSPMRPRLLPARPRAARGSAAFVFTDPKPGRLEVFDFIHVTERTAGYKVRFHSDQLFREMSTANVIFEYNDRFTLAEPLAFQLYNDVGNAASKTDFVRLTLNGHPAGYHLLFEQVNGAFLRRNKLKPEGDLYKILWYENGIEGQHEKQNNPGRDHSELIALIESLQKANGDEQWQIIEKNFNVDQVVNYFAVNMVLSHWDGYFNNYFTFHDSAGTKKWEMYPWDQDKTWGFHDATAERVFYDMPLTFGMEGDRPPGGGEPRFNPGSWWRPGGFFSKPLLANPEFRKRFLKRTHQILEKIYTEEKYFPKIDALAEKLKPEVPIRARVRGEKPEEALKRFERNVASLKEHLAKRREFLLKQPELQAVN